jgi:hypothetical protein
MPLERPRRAARAVHGVVHRDDRAFCGWPFYCGLWKLQSGELVAGFKKIATGYADAGAVSHSKLTQGRGELYVIRSRDRGRSWDAADMQPVFRLDTAAAEIEAMGPRQYGPEGPLDFAGGNVLIMSGAVPALFKPNSQAWLRASTDGGITWRRPILLPLSGLPSLTGHGSSMLRSDGMNLLGLTVTTEGGWNNRPLVYASPDGVEWRFLSFITPASGEGSAMSDRGGEFIFGAIRHIYPRLIELKSGRILAAIRFQREATGVIWTDIYASEDGGRSWGFLSRANDWGAPGDLVAMRDGRVVCVYGYRLNPPGIRARVSGDGGETWGGEIVLRDDGGSWDLGYPRAIELGDGEVLTVYYMNLKNDPIQMNGGVRHIAQTVFTPD